MKNNYDDLQRFKEKTQTLDIDFKDMSGQAQEAAEHSKWALIRQLAKEEHQTSLGGGQRIDLPQPQPLRGDEFTAPPPEAPARPATLSAQPTTSARSAILDSLSGSNLPTARTAERDPSALFPPPPPPQKRVAADPVAVSHAEPVRPAMVADLKPTITPATPHSEPERFGALFRSRNSEPSNLPKETLLKPLLEKIALCR
ncbi:cellulose biosynthesis protein BcsO [Pantoea sp. B550]|uniref:cellulose biosynthesis protein BcsO n=1 Tax=Pantoea TaxID=53335 RepID=UPI000E9043CA|nr:MULTISPECIES: cellulose biosynthesis protein BcsO [Pantoea]HBV90401.1 cellulose biosynthesis protein BcsO [Pantoea sp.]MCP1206395.1 cellulose biosynthesis protein BcsO [Pantoea sp. B550]MCT2419672.1 cellulose biosynthesis protein BcsO [Pantoea sp. XY16]NBB55295.1 cellulose biosynthesis protein BcsO [Pantoea vagans]QZX95621.1 cellulose biosynthesis protein BcsO [Pantoea alfalfae]